MGWLGFLVQKLLDWFYYFRRFLLNAIVWLSVRFFAVECSFSSVKDGTYPSDFQNLNLDGAGDLDTLLSEVKERCKAADERRTQITDKCKTLVTLCSFLIAAVGAFLPKTFDFTYPWMKWVLVAAVLCLLVAMLVVWSYFRLGVEQTMDVTNDYVRLDKDNLRKSLINRYLSCEEAIGRRSDYLANVYETARFYFLSSFLMLVLLFCWDFVEKGTNDKAKKEKEKDAIRISSVVGTLASPLWVVPVPSKAWPISD
jgi:hypothetical protein